MRIVMLSDHETSGGAAISTSRLAAALIAEGEDVIRVVGRSDRSAHPWRTVELQHGRSNRPFVRLLRRFSEPAARIAARRLVEADLDRLLGELKPDVITVHNLHGAQWSPSLVDICLSHAPTAWRLADTWSFTGRCAYSYDCRKFITGCDASCPTPNEYPALNPRLIAGEWRRRRKLFQHRPELVAVCPSQWLAREAQSGLWSGHRVEVIPSGLPLGTYSPVDQALARAALGIDVQGPVVMTAKQNLANRRQGGDYLATALRQVKTRPLTLLTMGKNGDVTLEADGVTVLPLGYIDHERTKVLAYSAADFFVHSAVADNLPNVVKEALACGTPSIAFPVGGLPEMVRPGITGYLADEVSADSLATAIDEALNDRQDTAHLRQSARTFAEHEYSDKEEAQRYIALFGSMTTNLRPKVTAGNAPTAWEDSLRRVPREISME